MKKRLTEVQSRRLRVGDQIIVLAAHCNQHGTRHPAYTHSED